MLALSKSQEFNCTIDYVLERLNSVTVSNCIPFFSHLPADPYLEGNYRFRRFSHFQISNGHLVQLPHAAFFQSKAHNPLLGDVTREYLELEDELIQLSDFQMLVLEFFEFCQRCSSSNEVGVHQIRITADHHLGNPAPEGIHRDGVDLVGIVCVNRDNIDGGETHLYQASDRSLVFAKVLNPGELLLVNDRQFFHFTTPIQARSPQEGVRDVFVFTCPGLPQVNH
ncbi:2OG-Fe dioxygenase family protein [Oculatella sp. LEGE 06141]|uniref:2OG-Fe dioxygenase family protein n=1 Tax=Oculatella sp. LEGE 06141 TaxID=1828648 RepID=UPI0018808463|nr:2OG-Fe dioxygenase family protein [Oculatella sp. LEGE 06141]MBE9179578.1 2OG-Fe dioxygenase family protein [Oculatella sp. LEGE 06141]